MNKGVAIGLAALLAAALVLGCEYSSHKHSHEPPPVYVSKIISDQNADGDIAYDSVSSTYVVSSAVINLDVLAGIDPATEVEYRGFLDFPLAGSTGVPLDANIISATVELTISSVAVSNPGDTIPMILDMMEFTPPLVSTDFDRSTQQPLLSLPFVFYTSDAGGTVRIDITPFMQEAQRMELSDLQMRMLLDFSAATGLIQIDDSAAATAPLLAVRYE